MSNALGTGRAPRRARSAPLARETSDVTRFRGLLAASIAGALSVVALLCVSAEPGALFSPGALLPGHAQAGLDCASCHQHEAPEQACGSCHAGQQSRRSAHRRLLERGTLGCTDCHAGHAATHSLVFSRDESAVLAHGSRALASVTAAADYRPARTTRVPLVLRQGCVRCHQSETPTDPAAGCFSDPALAYQLCFDEHRAPGQAPAERDAAWEASRRALQAGLAVPGDWQAPLVSVLLGLCVAGVTWLVRRRRLARKSAPVSPGVLQVAERVRLPQVDTQRCLGCYACVDACPFDVLEVRNFVAVVARPDACSGVSLCEQRCPNGSLTLREGEPIDHTPRLDTALQAQGVQGLYLAGELTGLPLIRNAINQGAHVAHEVHQRLRNAGHQASSSVHHLVVVGAGPAGLSAILEAKRLGLEALALEQGSVAESIKSFPRDKLVLDPEIAADARASLWLAECKKEELVSKWTQLARRQRLPIRERHRVFGVETTQHATLGRVFLVRARDGAGAEVEFLTSNVLLALGKRGTPRKLEVPIPDGWTSRVHYALVDARPFAGRSVLVIGLGDSAMEAALALAAQPGCQVTVCARSSEFRRGKSRNIDALERLSADGRVSLQLSSRLTAFVASGVMLQTPDGPRKLAPDAVFVLIGAELPWGILDSLGVRRGALLETAAQTR